MNSFIPSPALSASLKGFFNGAELETLFATYQLACEFSALNEDRVIREEGVAFNPRPARIAGILIKEGRTRELNTIAAAFFACSNLKQIPSAKISDPILKLAEEAAQVVKDGAANQKTPNEALTIAAAIILDDIRHLHMTDMSHAEQLAFVRKYSTLISSMKSDLTPYLPKSRLFLRTKMRKIVDWIITPFYLFLFFGILVVFHPFLLIASRINHHLFRVILHLMCYSIVLNLRITAGTKFKFIRHGNIPDNTPLIIISNHQSMYDIPLLMWEFRDHTPLFISKRELARWVPSISLALRNMDTAIIDRKDPAQAISAISALADRGNIEHCAIFIFPEGTRARKGELKVFKARGFLTLCEKMPGAYIIPIAINNAWRVLEHNLLPIPWGITVTTTIHKPIPLKGQDPAELLQKVQGIIQEKISAV